MKFILGMLAMYLLMGFIYTIIALTIDDEDLTAWFVAFPFVFIVNVVINPLYKKIKYFNIKSIIYDYEKEKWYYCDLKDFKKVNKKIEESKKYSSKKFLEELEKLKKENPQYNNICLKYYKKYNMGFNELHCRYVPKEIWSDFPKYK